LHHDEGNALLSRYLQQALGAVLEQLLFFLGEVLVYEPQLASELPKASEVSNSIVCRLESEAKNCSTLTF
jgi:hypothetical protein